MKIRQKRSGQGATEYIIILVLVAVASIAVITVFGDTLRDIFNVSTKRLQGDTEAELQNKDASDSIDKSLKDF